MRKLWTEERVTFDGEYYHLRNATVYDRPEHPIPLYVAASGESAARLAGRVADGFICTSGKGAELYTGTLLPAVAEAAAKAKRDGSKIEKMIEMKVSFDTDKKRALEDTRHWAALALPAEDKHGVEDPLEMERRSAALPIEKVASRWLVSSDPDEHVEQIATYVGYGFTHLVFHAPGPDQLRFIELYGREILPRLRKRFA
jgi:coenzyme F420-dependent glucose-6-phosphate dehydrogenase